MDLVSPLTFEQVENSQTFEKSKTLEMRAFLLLFGLAILGFTSCGPRRPCTNEKAALSFTNFDSTQIDSIVIVRFDRNSGYTNPLDSTLISKTTAAYTTTAGITYVNAYKENVMTKEYDWIISVPATGKRVKFHVVSTENATQKCGGAFRPNCDLCESRIEDFTVDGTKITRSKNYTEVNIRK